MAIKPKIHYAVYLVAYGEGVYAPHGKKLLGETWATSAAKACSNVRYRLRDKNRPHGGYSIDVVGDILDEGSVMYTYEAEEI